MKKWVEVEGHGEVWLTHLADIVSVEPGLEQLWNISRQRVFLMDSF